MLKQTEQQKIGYFIKELREKRGMTQEEFAQALNTSQSSIPRMEKGEQNFTTELLQKISNVLDNKVVSINDSIPGSFTSFTNLFKAVNEFLCKYGQPILFNLVKYKDFQTSKQERKDFKHQS